MLLFLLIFLSIYGAMNSYLLWKLHQAFPRMGWWLLGPAGFLLVMVTGPLLVQFLVRWGLLPLARALSWLAYPWMAMIMWFLFLGLALDLWNLAVRGAGFWAPGAGRLALGPRTQLCALGGAVLLLAAWGLWEARSVRLERVIIRSDRLPVGAAPVRIVLIADLHMNQLTASGRLDRALHLIEEARPDLVVSAGDLVDFPLPDDGQLTARLASVRPPLGKYAILGNHELYAEHEAGAGSTVRLLEAGGFRVLRGEAVQVGPIRLAGLDDPAERRFKTPSAIDEGVLLGPRGERTFTVLLKHRPEVAEATRGRLDLQLSGHTHRGQVFPFGLVVRLMSPRVSGLYALDGSAQLYVSRGTGTWGPPLRLLSRPEVTLFIIEPAPGSAGPAGVGGGVRGTSDNRVFPQGDKPPGPIIHM